MAQHSQLEENRFILESQIRECYGRCAYTHKTHEKMAERLHVRHKRAKWANIILSSVVAAGATSAVFSNSTAGEQLASYTTLAFSILSLVFNAYLKDLDPGALAQRHREAASDIWSVREAYLSLIADVRDPSIEILNLRERRDELQTALHDIYHSAPHTDGKAYGLAQDALKNREDLTFSEEEIDLLLPAKLRRGSRKDSHPILPQGLL